MAAGNRWIHAGGIGPLVLRAVGPSTAGGLSGDLLRTENADGSLITETLISHQPDGVYAVPVSGHDAITTALGAVRLFGDTTPGTRFVQAQRRVDVDLDGDGRPEDIAVFAEVTVVDNAALTTPAGTFPTTLHLRTVQTLQYTYTGGGGTERLTTTENTWYAPGIGPLRRDIDVPGFATDRRLLSGYVVAGRPNESQAPTVLSVGPADGATTRFPTVSVQFSEAMDAASTCAAFSVRDAQSNLVAGRCTMLVDRVEFEPTAPVAGAYTARLAASATDLAGNRLAAERTWRFTLSLAGPVLLSSSIADGAADVPLDSRIVLRFSTAIDPGSFAISSFQLSADPGGDTPIDATLAGDTVTITPRAPLARGTRYQLLVPATLTDAVGNALGNPAFVTFTTDAGRFAAPQRLLPATPGSGGFATAADTDRDGRVDVLLIGPVSAADSRPALLVRRQLADGTLAEPVAHPGVYGSCPTVDWMEAADFDGDGRIDVATGSSSCAPQWMRQSSDGAFVVAGAVPAVIAPAARAVDLDGDGDAELLVRTVERIEVWHMVAGQWQALVAPLSLPAGSYDDIAGGDLDGDGRADIAIVGTLPQGRRLVVFAQQPGGSFGAAQEHAAGDIGTHRLDLVDANDDGRLDAVLSSPFGADTRLLLQQPGAGFGAPVALAVASMRTGVVAADLDGDGRRDLVSATFGVAGVHLRRTDGSLAPERTYGTASSASSAMRPGVADLNGDGRPDLLVGDAVLYQKATMLPDAARGKAIAGAALAARRR